jgi:ACS family hexuronate transporter-like MFS transporter
MTTSKRGYEVRLMILLSLAFGFVFFDRNALNYLAPLVAPDLHLSNLQVSMISAGFSFAWAVAGYLGGALSDATGRRKSVLLGAFVLFSLCSGLSGLATSFTVLLAARVLMGLSEGPIMPVMQSLVVAESSESRRGLNMGFVQNFGSNLIGSTVAPLVLVTLAALYGWRVAFYIAAVPGLILAVFIWRYVREPPPVPPPAQQASSVVQPAEAPRMPLLAVIKERNMWLCILISIFMVPWMILAWVFLPLFFVNIRHVALSDMSLLMSVLGVSAALFGFIVPGISDKVGRKPVVIAFSLIGVLMPISVLYYTGPLTVLAALIFIGWSASGVFPLFMGTIPSETIPARYIATSLGLVMGLGELIGGVLTPVGAGWAADHYGLQAPIYIEAACALIATVLALFLRETAPAIVNRGRQLPPSAEPRGIPATAGESPTPP